ncbi:hypothetical protein PspS34_03415 [Pseudomonas sp. S34]|uniref:hypothetical protein n=1 Tax=Pseudomonas sp. S34 TaxID=1573718 RepID=UPI00132EE60C|nr:hypothetical protein [Pseudomonas sp. S34]QHF37346.1 hypothetical protein PspS34_03415 [Pseudomonas sp. S34]
MSEAKDDRVEFSMPTKKVLAGRAGYICSHYDCLRNTKAPGQSKKRKDGLIGTGVAAHIYAASENGPRPPVGMTEEEIKDQSNGTWMCIYCSDLIDKFRWEYPAPRIHEMKRVREFAQHLTVTQFDAAYLVRWMGVQRFDQIVRDHLPDLVVASIIEKIREVGKRFIGDLCLDAHPIAKPPSSFSRKPLPIVIQQVGRSDQTAIITTAIASEYRWATEIATQFNQRLYEAGTYDVRLIDYGQVSISARVPETGELALEAVDLKATIMCKYNPTSSQGDVFLRASTVGGVKWLMEISGRPDAFTIASEMKLGTYYWPESTRQPPTLFREREAFESYATLIDRIAAGWDIVGRIGLRSTEERIKDNLHPGVFGISLVHGQDRLQEVQRACRKVRLAYELADKWDVEVYIGNLLDLRIDAATFREAVDRIMEGGPGLTHAIGDRLWLSDDQRRCLVVEYNCARIGISERFVSQPLTDGGASLMSRGHFA